MSPETEEAMNEPHNIYQAVQSVLADMPAIGKEGRAPANMGGYPFRSIEDITAALKPLLAKHGVSIIPFVIERRDSERSTSGNKVMFVTDLHIQFTFYGEGGDSFTASMWGQGTDMGDKAPQKAVTSAFKSMLSITFCISDAESDAERHDVPITEAEVASSPEERAMLRAKIEALPSAQRAAVMGQWKDRGFGSLLEDAEQQRKRPLPKAQVVDAAKFIDETAAARREAGGVIDDPVQAAAEFIEKAGVLTDRDAAPKVIQSTPDPTMAQGPTMTTNEQIVAVMKIPKVMSELAAYGVPMPTSEVAMRMKLVELYNAQVVCSECGKLTPESPRVTGEEVCACS